MSIQQHMHRPTHLRMMGKVSDNFKIADTGSSPLLFEDELNNRWVGKYNTTSNIYVIANELIATGLARFCEIPFADGFTRTFHGTDYYFSNWYDEKKLHEVWHITDPIKTILRNENEVFELLCFDIFILNQDRHWGNILVHGAPGQYLLRAIDHDRAFFSIGDNLSLINIKNKRFWWHWVHMSNLHLVHLSRFLHIDNLLIPHSVMDIPNEAIEFVVDSVPDRLLSEPDKDYIIAILKQRRDLLRKFLKQGESAKILKFYFA